MLLEILFIAIGLSMDAFAVSICKGLSMNKLDVKKAIIIGLYFGVFQALMPLLGFFLGISFQGLVSSVDHWITFALLLIIGINMVIEVFRKEENQNDKVNFGEMVVLAIATSIDAFAVGVTFAFLDTNIVFASSIIGLTTFILSTLAVFIGNKFSSFSPKKAEVLGGIILILMAFKILLEHLDIL